MVSGLPVGKISKPFGSDGRVIANLYEAFPENWNFEEPLYVSIDSLTVPLFLEYLERRGQTGAVMRFADIDNERRAAELFGLELFILDQEKETKDDDTLYLEDMVGYKASFDGRDFVGRIVGFVDSDHNPLFEIDIRGHIALVPAADELILAFNVRRREVTFTLPDGLLELYI